jgi:TP901 family phage tail tape measure protein
VAATRTLSVKFGTEGFAQAVSEMQRVAKSFDVALAKTQQSVEAANRSLVSNRGAGLNTDDIEKSRADAARKANQIISNSYKELRIKSETDLSSLRNQAISAYNAIRISGVASAHDIDRANLALKERLGQIDDQLEKNAGKARTWGQNLTESVQKANQAIKQSNVELDRNIALENAAIAAEQKRIATAEKLANAEKAAVTQKTAAMAQLAKAEAQLQEKEQAANRIANEWHNQTAAAVLEEEKAVRALIGLQTRLEAAQKAKTAANLQGAQKEEQAYQSEINKLQSLIALQEKTASAAYAKTTALKNWTPPIDLDKKRAIKASDNESARLEAEATALEAREQFLEKAHKKAREKNDKPRADALFEELQNVRSDSAQKFKAAAEAIQPSIDLSRPEPIDMSRKRAEKEALQAEERALNTLLKLDEALLRANKARSKASIEGAQAETEAAQKEIDSLEALAAAEREALAAAKARVGMLNDKYSPQMAVAEKEAAMAAGTAATEKVKAAQQVKDALHQVGVAAGTAAVAEENAAQKAVAAENAKANQSKAIAARERATWQRERATDKAFGALGVQSEAHINQQKAQLTDAYRAIRTSGIASARDIARAERALNTQIHELNRTLRGHESRWTQLKNVASGALKSIADNFAQTAGFTIVYGTINAIGNAIGSAIAFPFQAAKDYADFESQLKAIKVAADGADISPLRKEIELLAPKIGKMPQELATLATEFTRAGFTADQTSKLLRGVGFSAQATGEELSVVGEITRNTIKQFQISEQDYSKVSDVLVAGANKSAAGIGSLGEALSYVGPTASLSNQSLESTVTILAALSDVGITGSTAGTNFGEALQRIKIASAGASDELVVTTRGMKTAAQAVDELGVNFRKADGTMRPILEVLPELRKALKALPQPDQDVIMRVLFGERGGRAISGLLSKTDEQIRTLNKGITESGGAAEKAGAEMLSGFGGALEKLQASAEVGKLKFGEAIAPGLEAAAIVLDTLVGKMTQANGLFDEANAASKEFADYLKGNPELVAELDRQLTDLVRTSLHQASENAKQLLQYLKNNPHAIADGIASLKGFIDGLGQALKIAQQLGAALSFKFDPLGDTKYTLEKFQEGRETAKRSGFGEGEFEKRFKALEDKIPWYNISERMKRRNELIEQAISSFDSGGNLASGQKIYPIQGGEFVGGGGSFGAHRSYGGHTGEDITGSPGTPVYAVMDGMVKSIKTLDSAAKSFNLAINAADGTIQRYKHITPTVAPEQRIKAGQQIGTVAQKDALSTGPHLHYEVQKGDDFVDPKGYLKDSTPLSKAIVKEVKTAFSTPLGTIAQTQTPNQTPNQLGTLKLKPEPKVKPTIRVTKTGTKNAQGLEILQMDLIDNGSIKDSILITSGRATNQTFSTAANSAKGKKTAPIPEGEYGVGNLEQGNFGKSIGSTWVGLKNITPNQRGGFGIHFDNDFAIAPGSEGCLVLGDKSSIAKLQAWMKESDPSKLIVDYGFGTVADPTKTTKTEIGKTLDQERAKAAAARNQYQYLARIAAGESASGKNIGPNPQTGAYGEYQFTPETRKLLMNRAPNLDPWSKSKGTRDQAALKWIELYGQEIGTDILSMIRKGEFEAVDKLLGQKGPSGFAQFSSLPGGTEASKVWQDPRNLRKFAPIGEVTGDVYYKQAEEAKSEAEKKARDAIEKARKRADETLKQQQDLAKNRLEAAQKQELLKFDLTTSQMPDGEAKTARTQDRSTLERTQELKRNQLEIEQTLNQLLEERKQKLADIDAIAKNPDAKIEVTNRDITADITALNARKKALEDNYKAETQIQQNNTASELAGRSQELDKQIAEVNKTLSELKLQYADTSPETREAQALNEVNQEFDQHKQVIVAAIKATLDLITAKQAQGLATDVEINTLEQLKGKYLELQDIQNKQIGKSQGAVGLAEQQRKLDQAKAVGDIDSQLADAKATRLEKFGLPDQANGLREQAAIAQEMIRYKQQLLDLQATYKDEPQILDELIQKANQLNQINLTNIKDQFKSIGETIQDSAQSALTGFFTDVFQGTKSVEDAFRDMAVGILKTIASMAAQMLAANIVRGLGSLFGNAIGGGGGGFGSLLGFASGGLISGPGTGTSDSVLARVSHGEFIMNADAVSTWGPDFLHALNAKQMPASIVDVGSVSNNRSGGRQTVVNQTINVQTPDANSFNKTSYQRDRDSAETIRRSLNR